MRRILYFIVFTGCFIIRLHAQEIQLITPKLIDFGEVHEGEKVKGEICLINSGNEPIGIRKVRTSCGCTATQVDKDVYASGDTIKVQFAVDTRGFRNVVRKSITILFQENELENLKYTIQMHVFSELELSPRFISFRHVTLNPDTVLTEYFSVQNNTKKPVKINKITSNYDLIQVFPQSVTIPANKEHLLRVELKPKRKGQRSVSIYIETDHEFKSQILQPVYVQIEG